MHAFILAGGYATRLWPLTERRAKPLLPLAGKPLLTHIVEQVPRDIPITVSTNAAFEESFRRWIEHVEREDLAVRIEQTRSDDEKLGTLGATAQWILQEGIDDDMLLLTGDNYFGFSMNTFIARFSGQPLVAAYDIGDTSKASAFGTILLEEDGRTIRGFEEKPRDPQSSLVSTGASVIPQGSIPILLDYARIKPDNVGGIFEEFLRRQIPVECFTFRECWFDIGSFEAYVDATKTLVDARCIIPDSSVLEASRTEGSVVLGERCSVRESTLVNTVLFDDCVVEDCILEDCILDNRCVLKGIDLRGKMLREGTRLERG